MKRLQILMLFTLCGFHLYSFCQSGESVAMVNRTNFFISEECLEITLVSDFKKLRSQKKKGVYQTAYAKLKFSSKDSLADSIRIYARGGFRRELCQMPSLMVNFKGKKSSSLNELKKMKVVCGCTTSDYNERLVLMEYLAYKIYNLLTDMSFRVRLAKMTYKDLHNKIKAYEQYAFFIEDVDEMALRNNCREFEKATSVVYTDRNQTSLMMIFQYMIGNLDWSIPNYHNIKLIQPLTDTLAYPFIVPYDFDFSGLVNASYAFPNHEMFSVEKVTDRFYRGSPRSPEEIELVLNVFKSKKEKIMQLVQEFTLLEDEDRQTMVKYLEEFYNTINNQKKVQYHFVNGNSR
jgi:hypothetical protein